MNIKTDERSAQAGADTKLGMDLAEYAEIIREIDEQPPWRAQADKEMDYADGNQLGSDLLAKQQELGIPPAIEDLIGPALLSIQGYEAAGRTDWRVTASGETGGQDLADAMNSRLNQAERESKADRACSDAFRPQAAVGLGFVEVKREQDSFEFPYLCQAVHRNEIDWDTKAKDPMLKDGRWLRRKNWLRAERIIPLFPQHKELIETLGRSGGNWWAESMSGHLDGGASTGLRNAWGDARGWSVEESRWYNSTSKELLLVELWYRRWESVLTIKAPDGRVVEYDEDNEAHALAVLGGAKVARAVAARVRRAYWLGPHLLDDSPTPYTHAHFPYVPFWGFKEDRTGVPYGYVRGMVYQQDALNSGTAKLRWGMSAVQLEYTEGTTDMTDAQLARTVGRVDSRIKLKAEGMARPGARFDVKRDYQLTDQHFQLLQNSRAAIERVSAMTAGFMGKQGTATSGLQEQTQVEQSNQALGRLMDNFRAARSQVGELLLAMIIEDMGTDEATIIIEGDSVREDRAVVINKPEVDENGLPYLSNDLQRTRLKVTLQDVPSTASYRGQQLNALSEAVKSLPDNYKVAIVPFLVSLMDLPFKPDVIKAIKAVDQQQTPEQIQAQIDAAVKDAMAKAGTDLKAQELQLKYSPERMRVEIDKIVSEVVKNNVGSSFAAMQAGEKIALVPAVAPIADVVMATSGWRQPSPAGQDPNFPQPQGVPVPQEAVMPAPGDTTPTTPTNAESALDGVQQGIETMRAD